MEHKTPECTECQKYRLALDRAGEALRWTLGELGAFVRIGRSGSAYVIDTGLEIPGYARKLNDAKAALAHASDPQGMWERVQRVVEAAKAVMFCFTPEHMDHVSSTKRGSELRDALAKWEQPNAPQ